MCRNLRFCKKKPTSILVAQLYSLVIKSEKTVSTRGWIISNPWDFAGEKRGKNCSLHFFCRVLFPSLLLLLAAFSSADNNLVLCVSACGRTRARMSSPCTCRARSNGYVVVVRGAVQVKCLVAAASPWSARRCLPGSVTCGAERALLATAGWQHFLSIVCALLLSICAYSSLYRSNHHGLGCHSWASPGPGEVGLMAMERGDSKIFVKTQKFAQTQVWRPFEVGNVPGCCHVEKSSSMSCFHKD